MQSYSGIPQLARENKAALLAHARWGGPPKDLYGYKLNALALLSAETLAELCRLLGSTIPVFTEAVNAPAYRHYAIPKKRGGERHIFAPEWPLKQLQRRLNDFLQAYYLWIKPDEAHGFVINPPCLGGHCNIVGNAAVHVGKKHVLNIDLKDFFPGISARRIKELFLSPCFNYNEQTAIALTLITTYQGRLPTGAPTSPVLSNFICLPLDAALRAFCLENGLRFTRYADDLTFSADTMICGETIRGIIRLINDNGFEINEKKLRAQASNRKQTVTGLTVNEKVNVDRRLLKKIRAMLHDLSSNGVDVAARRHFNLKGRPSSRDREYFFNRLEGYINFVGQVRGKSDPVYRKFAYAFRNSRIGN